jgi:hypothetical protein
MKKNDINYEMPIHPMEPPRPPHPGGDVVIAPVEPEVTDNE